VHNIAFIEDRYKESVDDINMPLDEAETERVIVLTNGHCVATSSSLVEIYAEIEKRTNLWYKKNVEKST
jgi:hypothetical protein